MTAAIPDYIRKIAEKHMAENVSPMFPEYHAFEGVVASAILDERERCAQIADGFSKFAYCDEIDPYDEHESGVRCGAMFVAKAIRQPPTGE